MLSRLARTSWLIVVLASMILAANSPVAAQDLKEGGLVFSLKTWEGEYSSKDIPGGVESTPVIGAIYVLEGAGLKKIAQLGRNSDFPTFSPDGRWVYFQSNAAGQSHIYRCRPDGSELANLTEGNKLGKPWKDSYGYVLSRDGSSMLYTVHDGNSGRVAIAKADGSQPRLLFAKHGYTYMGALSPTADRVVVSGPARGYRLLIADLPDGEPRELAPNHPDSFAPQFTPDGKAIVFIRRDGDVYRIDADGKNLRRLTTGNRYVEFKLSAKDHHGSTDAPHVSADGKRIAYIAVSEGIPNVWTMNIDGSAQQQITFRKTACGRVRWSPDSKQLAFVSFEGKYPQLFTILSSGGEPRQRTRLDGAVNFVAWRP